MQFSNTSTKDGIIQMVESLTKLGDGGITNDSVLVYTITGFINQAYKKVISALLRVDTNWRWDDSHNTDFPIATITMVSGQRDYTLPGASVTADFSTFYKLLKVRVLNIDGTWSTLAPLDPNADESTDSGLPLNYRLIGNSIRLSPLPLTGSVALTDGLEVQIERGASYFVAADTTKQPGFNEAYHDILAYDAAAVQLMPTDSDLALRYLQIVKGRLADLQTDYAYMNDDVKRRLIPAQHSNK